MSKFYKRHDNFGRRHYVAKEPLEYFQVDLVDLSRQNSGYIMNAIDIFNRYAHSVKLSSKTQSEIQRGLNEVFEVMGTPKNLQSDLESGVYSTATQNFLKDKNVNLFYVTNSYNGKQSAPIVERLQGTQKDFYINFMHNNNTNHQTTASQVAVEFPKYYNNKPHAFLKGMTPAQAQSQVNKVKSIQLNQPIQRDPKEKLKVGDKVRLQAPEEKIKGKFDEQYYKWHYEVVEVKPTNPTTYKLKVLTSDRKNEIGLILDGSYYKQQLIKI